MPKNQNKPQFEKSDLNHKKIKSVEKNTGEENAINKSKNFKNVHVEPADEQQFENNTLGSNHTK